MYNVYGMIHTENKTIEKVEYSINIYWLIEILLKNCFTPSIILIEIKNFVKLFSQQCRNEGKRHRLSDQPIHVCCHAAPSHNWATSQARLGRHKKCGSQGGGQAVDKKQYICTLSYSIASFSKQFSGLAIFEIVRHIRAR